MGHLLSVIAILAIFLLFPIIAKAHSGRTNSSGCHNDYIHGGYHCHPGYSSYSAPVLRSYYWNGHTYYSYQTYMTTRWDDIQKMYRELLFRPFNSQEEGHIYTDQTDMSYFEIRAEILGSDEYKQKHPPEPTPIASYKPLSTKEKTDYSWIWLIVGLGWWIPFALYEPISDWFKNRK